MGYTQAALHIYTLTRQWFSTCGLLGNRNAGQRVPLTQNQALPITNYYANQRYGNLIIIVFKDPVCERRIIPCIFLD